VLLEIKNNLVPFFIETLQVRRQSAFVKFRAVNGPSETDPLIGCAAYLPLSELPPLKGKKQFYYHEVTGFEVVDKTKGVIGTIRSIHDNQHQPIIEIVQGEKEILIPLVDEFLEKVDRAEKKLFIDTPEGLIDLYLE
jgi:16S rRNA processing protein RimM